MINSLPILRKEATISEVARVCVTRVLAIFPSISTPVGEAEGFARRDSLNDQVGWIRFSSGEADSEPYILFTPDMPSI